MSNDDDGILNEEILLSDNDSNTASIGSRVSEDSGIEDWNDDMTIQTEQDNMVMVAKELGDKSPISPIKEEETLSECIFPALPELTQISDYKKDVLGSDAISGVCGLYNLGNTCFMNAALQCLLVTSALKKLVVENDILQNESEHTDKPANLLLLVQRFQELFRKVLSGKYSILHPGQLHLAIAKLHPVLGDYKQHDSQEFLSFLLNTIHDLFNRTAHNKASLNYTSVSGDLSDNIVGDVSKRLKMDSDVELNTPMEPDAGVECEEHLTKAECAWREYTANNQSVIVDSFQGQFQSVIVCKKCGFVSTTYEPFMSLSLPIPYAMEKQFVVTLVPSLKLCALPGMMSVAKYCVTVNKHSTIRNVKDTFLTMVKKNDTQFNTSNIVFAEVDRSANVCILDDRTQISYLSKSKKLYAIEVLQSSNTFSLTDSEDFVSELSEMNGKKENGDCNINGSYHHSDDARMDTSMEIKDNNNDDNNNNDNVNDDSNNNNNNEDVEGAAAWHSCGICLEEIFDEELKTHLICGGLLCDTCLTNLVEVNKTHKFHCPICNRYISTEDFTPLIEPKENGDVKKAIRQILIPVMFRHDMLKKKENSRKFHLFGHPVICSLPSQCESTTVIDTVAQILQNVSHVASRYDVIITDGAGLSCGTCGFFSSCAGCPVKDTLQLKPGSCLSVHFHDNIEMVVKTMELFREDMSMKEFRNTDVVQLDECLEKFGDSELLTKDNPWFCTQCQTNQMAVKNMTVTRWPDTLIVHLKRFYYEGNQGCKITCPVNFALEKLNIDILTCVDGDSDGGKDPVLYNLSSFICHTGSLLGGHYTAMTKASPTADWYCFNDESFKKMEPTEEHKQEGYVLFYQRKCSR